MIEPTIKPTQMASRLIRLPMITTLLQFNPVQRKVPVLVESPSLSRPSSLNTSKKHGTPLLPKDPHERAMAHFLIDHGHQKLHGFWASPYVYRAIWALKLKGVEYEYIEEDFSNKSAALLKYNPIHKKVPVLVHNGKPVIESEVILQYIEDTWPDKTPLLPEDPHERAMARFWINFGQQKGLTFFAFFLTSEEDKHKTAAQVLETLKIIEDQALGDKKFFGGNTINMVDLFYGWLAYSFGCMEQISGVEVLQPETLPRLHRWTLDFKQEPVIKENVPDTAMLLEHFQRLTKHLRSLGDKFKPG